MTRSTRIVEGALAGVAGAGCMTVLRMAARRWGLIDRTPPQATRAWLSRVGGVRPDGGATRHVTDALVHIAVSAGGGAAYGAMAPAATRPAIATGVGFGLALWAAAFGLVAPALGITRSPWRRVWRETAVNVAAHVLYGLSLAVVAGELGRQAAGEAPRALRARVG